MIDISKFFVIAGPCVIESEEMCFEVAQRIRDLSMKYGVQIVFKASWDKANRSRKGAFRGIGMSAGLQILDTVRKTYGLPVTTDVHEAWQVNIVQKCVDILQIPAFLCRQTDLLEEAGKSGLIVNVKKGQFMSPSSMEHVIGKINSPDHTWITERGTCFGYGKVVDFHGMLQMRTIGVPVIFDASHSSAYCDDVIAMARAAVTGFCDGLFLEVHPDPDNAKCDGMTSISLDEFEKHLPNILLISKYGKYA